MTMGLLDDLIEKKKEETSTYVRLRDKISYYEYNLKRLKAIESGELIANKPFLGFNVKNDNSTGSTFALGITNATLLKDIVKPLKEDMERKLKKLAEIVNDINNVNLEEVQIILDNFNNE